MFFFDSVPGVVDWQAASIRHARLFTEILPISPLFLIFHAASEPLPLCLPSPLFCCPLVLFLATTLPLQQQQWLRVPCSSTALLISTSSCVHFPYSACICLVIFHFASCGVLCSFQRASDSRLHVSFTARNRACFGGGGSCNSRGRGGQRSLQR